MKAPQLSVFNYSIQNAANNSLDIFIDGDIVDAETQDIYKAWFGDDTSVSYKSFRSQVAATDAQVYNVYINSGGGLVTDAMAIHDFLIDLQSKGKTVNTIGRGIIASAATYILMAGNNAQMSSNSWLMIHNVSGMAWGNVNEIENYAQTMRKFNDAANDFYQKATGLTKTVIGNMMDAETWMTASEAKEKGFIKSISGESKFSQSIKPEQWQFQNKAVLNSYNSFTQKNSSEMEVNKITEAITNGFNGLLDKLGLSNKKDDAAVQNAFKEFSEGITDSLKDVPDADGITNQVNDAVTNALKEIGKNESFVNAITEATKNTATKDDVKNEVSEGLKEVLTKTEFTNQFKTATDTLTKAITDKMGKQSTEGGGANNNNSRKPVKNSRLAGADWQAE